MCARYRQTFSDAFHAIPLLQEGDGLGWDQSVSQWRIYALTEGTDLEPEIVRVKAHLLAVSWSGLQILHALRESKKIH